MNLGPLFEPPDEDDEDEDTAPELTPPRSETVAEARAYIERHRNKGVICPCCDQRVQTYARSLGALQARWLLGLTHASERRHGNRLGWTGLSEIRITGDTATKLGGEYGKLQHWGLAEKHADPATWRATPLGCDWIDGLTTVPRTVYLLRNEPQDFSDERITFADALARKFSRDEVMSGAEERP